jgi:uncharacterized protein (TIRG00374 family)
VTTRTRHFLIGLLKYGLGFGALGYMLASNWNPTETSPGIRGLLEMTPDVSLLAAIAALYAAVLALQYARWYVLVRGIDLPFTPVLAAKLGLVGTYYNAFLPGSVGGDLMKAYYIARGQPGRRAAAVATVVVDRLVGLFGLLWFSALVGGGLWLAGDERVASSAFLQKIVRVCGVLVALAVAGWVVMGFLSPQRADRLTGRLNRVPKVGKALAEVWFAVWTYRQRPRVLYAAVALTAVCHVAMVLTFHLAVRVYPTTGPGTLAEHVVVAPIGFIGQALFPVPGGVGVGEGIFGYLYKLIDRPEATGVIGRLTLRVVEWGWGLVGLAVFLRMKGELPAVAAEAEAEGYGGHDDPPAAAKAG